MEKLRSTNKLLRPPFPPVVKKDLNSKPKLQLARSNTTVVRVNFTPEEIQKHFGTPLKIKKLDKLPNNLVRAPSRQKQGSQPPPPELVQEEGPMCKKIKLSIPSTRPGINRGLGKKQSFWVRKGPPPTKNLTPPKNSGNSSFVLDKEAITIFKKVENEDADEYINWLKSQTPPTIHQPDQDGGSKVHLSSSNNETGDDMRNATRGHGKITGGADGNKTSDGDIIKTGGENCNKSTSDDIRNAGGGNCNMKTGDHEMINTGGKNCNKKTGGDITNIGGGGVKKFDDIQINDTVETHRQTDSKSLQFKYRRIISFTYLIPALFSVMLVFKFGRK